MTVLVTGGSGVVGSSLVRRLTADGHRVRALARSSRSADYLRTLGAETVPGDLADVSSLIAGMTGTTCVFHVGGVNGLCLRDPSPMYRANVDGTRNVLRAANAAEVPRLVHTSSAVVLGERRGEVGHENSSHRGYVLSHYERSKTLAEQVAFAEADGVEVVAVNPSSVQGPGRATGTGKLILDVLNGDLRVLVDADLSIVDIDDCAEGHVLAWQRGEAGSRYVLSGFSTSTRQAIAMLESVLGRHMPVRFAPAMVATLGGGFVELGSRLRRRDPPLCREMIRLMKHGHTYDGSRAAEQLGLQYTPALRTLERIVGWFRGEGLLK